MSTIELAQYKQGCRDDNPRAVLVQREFERRDREAQHKLNRKLMMFAAIIGIIGTLLGAIAQSRLQTCPQENSSQISKYRTEHSRIAIPDQKKEIITEKSSTYPPPKK